MKLSPVTRRSKLALGDRDAVLDDAPNEETIEKETAEFVERIVERQQMFYADGRHALLVVLQGRDASGKDGVIRHVFGGINPQGCEVTGFGVPSEREQKMDFLWRIHQQVPAHGIIGVFNRSHYEDVLVVRVQKLVKKKVWKDRFRQINEFERLLTETGTVILKFFLHVSRDEQKKRLEKRLSDKTKNWKFRAGDLDDRAKWKEFTEAYSDAILECSTERAPWFVVPADDKPVRDWLIARTIADTLDGLDLRFPKADPEDLAVEIE